MPANRAATKLRPDVNERSRAECVGGPLDGTELSSMRGEFFRLMHVGWTGCYIREGTEYRWRPD